MSRAVEGVSSFSNDRPYVPIKIQQALDLHQGEHVVWIRVECDFLIRKKEAGAERASRKEERKYPSGRIAPIS